MIYRNILEKKFIEAEARSLYKESSRSFILFILFIFISFLTIYLTANGVRYLKDRMDDPYTNWLNVPFVSDMDYQEKLMSQEILEKYGIRKISPYRIGKFPLMIEGLEYYKKYQTVDITDPLFSAILSPENLLFHDSAVFNNERYINGLIISEELFESSQPEFGKDPYLLIKDFQGHDIFFPVLAVVKRLPNSCDIVISPVLENMRLTDVRETGFLYYSDLSYEYDLLVQDNISGPEDYLKDVILSGRSIFDILRKEGMINNYHLLTIQFNDQVNIDSLRQDIMKDNSILLYVPFGSNPDHSNIDPPHYFACNFKSLEFVEDFAEHIYSIGLEVEIGAVKSKKNFALVSLLTIVSLLFTILFASSSIVTIIINRVSLHITSVKRTLGTLMAFGLERGMIISYYIKLFSLIFLSIIGSSLLALWFIHFALGEIYEDIGFYYPGLYLLFYALFVLVILILSVYLYVKGKLSKYPSDLIFNR